jgi:hypothetical protein
MSLRERWLTKTPPGAKAGPLGMDHPQRKTQVIEGALEWMQRKDPQGLLALLQREQLDAHLEERYLTWKEKARELISEHHLTENDAMRQAALVVWPPDADPNQLDGVRKQKLEVLFGAWLETRGRKVEEGPQRQE